MKRLLNFLVMIRRLPPLSQLSGDEERLLFELRLLWETQGTLSVADAYPLAHSASATTAYRRLIALRDKGLLHLSVADDDKRKRVVKFTPMAEALFSIPIDA